MSRDQTSLSWTEWWAGGKIFARSTAIELETQPAPDNLHWLAVARVRLDGGDSVKGYGCSSSLDCAQAKAISELFERVCYLSQLDSAATGTIAEASHTQFQAWLQSATLEQCLAISGLVSTTAGFAAHTQIHDTASIAANEWLEKSLDRFFSVKGTLDQMMAAIRDQETSSLSEDTYPSPWCQIIAKTNLGFFCVRTNPSFNVRSSALAESANESSQKACEEGMILLMSQPHPGLDLHRLGNSEAVDLSATNVNFIPPPSVVILVNTSSGESRFVSMPSFHKDTLETLRNRLLETVSGNLSRLYPAILPLTETQSPVQKNLLSLLNMDLLNLADADLRAGSRILSLGHNDTLSHSERIVSNNIVFGKRVNPPELSPNQGPEHSLADEGDFQIQEVKLAENDLVREFIMLSEIETRISGAWYTPTKQGSNSVAATEVVINTYLNPDTSNHLHVFAAYCKRSGNLAGAAVLRLDLSQPILHFVTVSPKFRGNKVGARLVGTCTGSGLFRPGAILFAYVSVLNTASRRLFMKQGFFRFATDAYVV